MNAANHWQMARFRLGRATIHIGLHILPPGRVRSELYQLIDEWATRVRAILEQTNEGN